MTLAVILITKDPARHGAWLSCPALGGVDPQLGRPVCAAGQPACTQLSLCIGLSGSDRKYPALTGRSGTQPARRLRSRTTVGAPAPWSSSPPSELRITRVFSFAARGFKARRSFMFASCCRWRSLVVDGSSRTSRGHGSVMRRPGSRWAAPSNNRPHFSRGVRQVGADRARVMRCRRSLLVGGGCCGCRHRCCKRLLTGRGHSASFMAGSVLNLSGKLTYSPLSWCSGRLARWQALTSS